MSWGCASAGTVPRAVPARHGVLARPGQDMRTASYLMLMLYVTYVLTSSGLGPGQCPGRLFRPTLFFEGDDHTNFVPSHILKSFAEWFENIFLGAPTTFLVC